MVNWLRANPMAEARKQPYELDDFEEAYFEAALWSTNYAETEEPLDDFADVGDIARLMPQWYNEQLNDIADFRRANWAHLSMAGTPEQNGHDFWLTREGHGAGFWDRGYGATGEHLTKAAKVYGTAGDQLSIELKHLMEQEG